MPISAEQCAALLRGALSSRPEDPWSEERASWFGEVAGIISAHNQIRGRWFDALIPSVTALPSGEPNSISMSATLNAQRNFIVRARAELTRLELTTNAFTSRQLDAGSMHDYFEEIRELIAGATQQVLFVDPYIDASFVRRYLPQIPTGIAVRLLTSEKQESALREPLQLYTQQHSRSVALRVFPHSTLHDRYLFVDDRVYQSGASFKDGARNAPTSINQIVDVAADVSRAHEANWASARVIF